MRAQRCVQGPARIGRGAAAGLRAAAGTESCGGVPIGAEAPRGLPRQRQRDPRVRWCTRRAPHRAAVRVAMRAQQCVRGPARIGRGAAAGLRATAGTESCGGVPIGAEAPRGPPRPMRGTRRVRGYALRVRCRGVVRASPPSGVEAGGTPAGRAPRQGWVSPSALRQGVPGARRLGGSAGIGRQSAPPAPSRQRPMGGSVARTGVLCRARGGARWRKCRCGRGARAPGNRATSWKGAARDDTKEVVHAFANQQQSGGDQYESQPD